MHDLSTDEAIALGVYSEVYPKDLPKKETSFIKLVLKSGVVFRFCTDGQSFRFNEDGWFTADGFVKMPREEVYSGLVENFTCHANEVSCYWNE